MPATVAAPTSKGAEAAHAILEVGKVARPEDAKSPGAKRAEELRRKMDASGPREVIRGFTRVDRMDKRRIDQTIDKSFPRGERLRPHPVWGDRSTLTGERFGLATYEADLARRFAEEGFDSMDVGGQGLLLERVYGALSEWPDAKAAVDSLSVSAGTDAVGSVLKNIINKPEMRVYVRKLLEERTDPLKALDSEGVLAQARKQKEAEEKYNAKRGEFDRKEQEQRKVTEELGRFDPSADKAQRLKDAELKAAEARIALPVDESNFRGLMGNVQRLQAQLVQAEGARRGDIQKQIDSTLAQAHKAQAKVSEAKAKIAEEEKLLAEKKDLEQRQKQLEEEVDAAKAAMDNADDARRIADADYEQERIDHDEQEAAFTQGLENIVKDAAIKYIEKQAEIAEQKQRSIYDRDQKNATNEAEGAILNQLKTRWDNKGFDKRGNVRVSIKNRNGDQALADFDTMMDQDQGLDPILREMLVEENRQRVANGQPEIEIDLADLSNPQLRQEAQKRILDVMEKTKQFNSDRANKVAETEWGQELIESSLNNPALKKVREAAMKEAGINPQTNSQTENQTLLQALKQKKKLGVVLLMIAALGAGVMTMVGPGVAASLFGR